MDIKSCWFNFTELLGGMLCGSADDTNRTKHENLSVENLFP